MTDRIPTLAECMSFLEVASQREILILWKEIVKAYKGNQRKEVQKLDIEVGELVDVRLRGNVMDGPFPGKVLRVNERTVTVLIHPGTSAQRKWRVIPSSIIRRQR